MLIWRLHFLRLFRKLNTTAIMHSMKNTTAANSSSGEKLHETVQYRDRGRRKSSKKAENVSKSQKTKHGLTKRKKKSAVKRQKGEQDEDSSLNGLGSAPSSAFKIAALELDEQDNDTDNQCILLNLCCTKKRNSELPPARVTLKHLKFCRTMDQFLMMIKLMTRKVLVCVPLIKEITRRLACSTDPNSDFHKLSVIGGNLWLLTYAIGDFVEPSKLNPSGMHHKEKNPDIRIWIENSCEVLEDLAREAQSFAASTETFSIKIRDIRDVGAEILKQILRKFQFSKDPFLLYPEINIKTHRSRPPKRKPLTSDQLPIPSNVAKWATHTVLYQEFTGGSWEPFVSLQISDRIAVFVTFLEESLYMIMGFAGQFHTPENAIQKVRLPDATHVCSLLGLANAMLSFITNYDRSGDHSEAAQDIFQVQETMEAFWLTLDALYEAAFGLHHIVRESRNIVEICYVYILNFYKWKLKSFEALCPERRDPAIEKYQKNLNIFVDKLLGSKKLGDAALYLSLSEFASSPYKKLSQEQGFSSQGNSLKLE